MKIGFLMDNKLYTFNDSITYPEFIEYLKSIQPLAFEFKIVNPHFVDMYQTINEKTWQSTFQLMKRNNKKCIINYEKYDTEVFLKDRPLRVKVVYLGEDLFVDVNIKCSYDELFEKVMNMSHKNWPDFPKTPTFRHMEGYRFISIIDSEESWRAATKFLLDDEIVFHVPSTFITKEDIEKVKKNE
jgi:hypothetical protein